jgi:DNA-binding response OmpR family regulator
MHWLSERRRASRWQVLVETHDGTDVTGVAHALRVAGLYDVEEFEAEVGMPSFDGTDLVVMVDVGARRGVVERIQRARFVYRDVPIVVLSDDPAPMSESAWLRAGANDCMPIPFVSHELLQRIFDLVDRPSFDLASAPSGFRLKAMQPSSECSPTIHLNENDFAVTIEGLTSHLTEVTFRVVEYLVQRAGTWVRSPELQLNAIGAHAKAGASNVRFHVHRAREQFQHRDFARYLHSWPRRGYMWSFDPCDTRHCQQAHGEHIDCSDAIAHQPVAPPLRRRVVGNW